MQDRPCPCGSGKSSWWAKDARGIELARVCEDCEAEKLKGYRHEVLTDANYDADEPIEPDDGAPWGSQRWAETYGDDLGESPDY